MWLPLDSWRVTHNMYHHIATGEERDPDISNYGVHLHKKSHVLPIVSSLPTWMLILGIFVFTGQYFGLTLENIIMYMNIPGPRTHCRGHVRYMWSIWVILFIIMMLFYMFRTSQIFARCIGLNFMFACIVVQDHGTLRTCENTIGKRYEWSMV